MNEVDLLDGFATPPDGYGEVPFYWWVGDKLTRERLLWQLEQLEKIKPSGLQVNYAHTDRGGNAYGLTMPSDPPLFSEAWWELFVWWAGECNRRGIAVSVSDYTLGIVGQGWWMDEILKDNPAMAGRVLEQRLYSVAHAGEIHLELPENLLCLRVGELDLLPFVSGRRLCWQAAAPCRIVAVYFKVNSNSVDPLHPQLGAMVIDKFFRRFEERLPGEAGRGLNFFFSDELTFGVGGKLWTDDFAAAFQAAKGYDLLPLLPALFEDIGDITPKVRLDYYDVMLDLIEKGYFIPVYEWHRQRGMVYGCDHGGRGLDPLEFGDYIRTQRWMSGPGCDQPRLEANVVKNKVASSIAHLYRRPRVWLEGYHSSGWGTSTADLTRATAENFISGQNLLSLHGLYYSLQGGWWEWAPPCNHFRMPYWSLMPEWMDWLRRISYLMSQGVHRCDVAIVYPVAAMQAETDGKTAAKVAFDLGTGLFDRGLDFDFIDDESLSRCTASDGELRIAGESYRVLVLPSMVTVRHATIAKALGFCRCGGLVVAVGTLPEASERQGRSDFELLAMVDEMFGREDSRGVVIPEPDVTRFEALVGAAFDRDFLPASPCRVNHRIVGDCDIFMITRGAAGTVCDFRATGKVELWNPWQGTTSVLPVVSSAAGHTRLRLPLDNKEAQFIVFSPGEAEFECIRTEIKEELLLEGAWDFELQPTMDNRWGDFRLPASRGMIGAEARRLQYGEGDTPEQVESWQTVTCGFGPYFEQTGPLAEDVDPDTALWRDYCFSWREGVAEDPGHQGYHGLKASVSDDFLVWGKPRQHATQILYEPENTVDECHYFRTYVYSESARQVRLNVSGDRPDRVLISGKKVDDLDAVFTVEGGYTSLLLRYRGGGRGAVVVIAEDVSAEWRQEYPLSMSWFHHPGVLPFDVRRGRPVTGWYRFIAPPGLRRLKPVVDGKLTVRLDGMSSSSENDWLVLERSIAEPVEVIFQVEHKRGVYGGAALTAPVELDCGPGKMFPGDWSECGVLESYSGGAWYRRKVKLDGDQLCGRVILDLGQVVAGAKVLVNGRLAGVLLAPPWRLDITEMLNLGDNHLEILIYNTLANHYLTIPTRYRGSPVSGLLGPVRLLLRCQAES